MPQNKNTPDKQAPVSYEEQMSDLRERLAGRPYCKDVHDMLPDLSKAHIRNVVNGRGKNPLVLAALKIVVHKLENNQQQIKSKLEALAGQLQELEAAA